ncbi:hypothetical protein UFOVP1254_49 [uncultured Caudovirales phage]|uniref:Uncharacterized protein n=1 Tax=uncultured Caudovirales phage TaxID=2100421 RepID=A0A6J5RJB6_9CAUD|nr:hypothetical protein UFOVP1254_49 [uncultured Caudovirales phage]
MAQQLVEVKGGAFREYVRDAFNLAAQAFSVDPSANNWNDLKIAMWAWRHVKPMNAAVLSDAAHEHLIAIAEFGKGDRDFSEK